MRLIDADALKTAFEEVYPLATNEMGSVVNKRIYDIIDNAPTVEFPESITIKCNMEEDKQKLLSALRNARVTRVVEEERPTGEWMYDNTINNWKCSECGETPKTIGYVGTAKFMYDEFKFCNHCGAKMTQEEEEENEDSN